MADFAEYMRELNNTDKVKKQQTVAEIMMLCAKSASAVSRWANGLSDPSFAESQVIAEIIGKPIDELFPAKGNTQGRKP